MCVRLLLTISLFMGLCNPAWCEGEPIVKLTGPTNATAGEFVTITTTGTIGKDPKFDCFPPNKNWTAARALDKDELFISFSTMVEGTYNFTLAVNEGGKTGFGNFTITVGQPKPPGPATFAELLGKAYSQEGNTDQRMKLLAFYKEMTNQIDSFQGSNNDFDVLLKQSAEKYLGKPGTPQAILPLTRRVVGEYFGVKFGKPSLDPLNKPLFKSTFNEVISALTSLTP